MYAYSRIFIATFRKRLDDETGSDSQKNWQNWELVEYLSDGQDEINKELQLLKTDQDFTEVNAYGTITITGTTGQITSVSVDGVPIISAPVPFNGTLAQTATDLATAINAYSTSGININQALTTWLENTDYGIRILPRQTLMSCNHYSPASELDSHRMVMPLQPW